MDDIITLNKICTEFCGKIQAEFCKKHNLQSCDKAIDAYGYKHGMKKYGM